MAIVNPPTPLNGLARVVRPTLIATIGGTGTAAAKSAKERFNQYVGSKHHYVAMRAFDTDRQDDHTPRLVDNSEFIYLGGFNAQGVCQDVIDGKGFPHLGKWLQPWLDFQQVACGAGGIRPIGRLAYFYHRDRIEAAVRDALTSIRDGDKALRQFQETGVQVNIDAGIDIHLVSSLCGGTGSGMFLDLAFDLRRWARDFTPKDVTVTGHLVLPEAFRNKAVVLRSLEANCYAALQELDHFMNASGAQSWSVEYQPGNVLTSEHLPFDYCYLLSGLQQGGSMDIEGLTAIIGETLFLMTAAEVGQKVQSGAINTNAQRRGTRDSRNRACCYSSYGMLGIEIPSELLGRSLASELAKAAHEHFMTPVHEPNSDEDTKADRVLKSLGLNFEAIDTKIDKSLQSPDLTSVAILVNTKQEAAARAMLKSLLKQEHEGSRRIAEKQTAEPICSIKDLQAEVKAVLVDLMPQRSGFDRSLYFLNSLSKRLEVLRALLQESGRQAREAAERLHPEATRIENGDIRQMQHLLAEVKPWEEFVRLEARRIVFEGQAFKLASHADALLKLVQGWLRIRTMFDNLYLERPMSEDAYYSNRRSRAPVCPLDWFNRLLADFRSDMIKRVLTGVVNNYETWSQVSLGELSTHFNKLCTEAMNDHFKGDAKRTCDQLLADCYAHPSERHKEVVANFVSRARASWEVHETYPLRNNILEVACIGAVPDSCLYEALKESHREISAADNQWRDYVPILWTAHILSLIGLKRLPAYRQSFMDSINLDQRYDLHFFLDRTWVTELIFPDDLPEELEDYLWFTLSEAIGALTNPSGRYQFVANGQPSVGLDTYRHLSFAGFRQNSELVQAAKKLVLADGISSSTTRLENHLAVLRSKINRAAAAAPRSTRGSSRPLSREVLQVHQEIRAVLSALVGSEGAL